jgi:hypothetical protein
MSEAKTQEKLGWSRTLLAVGFFMVMVAVVIGAATDSRGVARYLAVAGALPMAVGLAGVLLEAVVRRWARRHVLPPGGSGGRS